MIKKLVVIGVGLIGGSLALSLRQADYCQTIIGYGRDEASLQTAQNLGVIDQYSLDMATVLYDADMVFLAVPVGAMDQVMQDMLPYLSEQTLITDGGSTKRSVLAAAKRSLRESSIRFVPGHPIAGGEKTGVEAALPGLYQGRRIILTPDTQTDPNALSQVRMMWEAAGGVVEIMPVELHDQVLAATSHLPHVVAFAVVDALFNMPSQQNFLRYAGGGFRDFTRIAGSDPVMWRDICLHNAEAILEAIDALQSSLDGFASLIRDQQSEALRERMAQAKQVRDRYMDSYDIR